MIWIGCIIVAILAIADNYAWFATDPGASLAMAQGNCKLPTLHCLRQAKSLHAQLVQEHTDAYWCHVNKDYARAEHEKQAKEAHDLYVAQKMAKADKWDKWEVSPPTIIHNDIYKTINHGIINHKTLFGPTFVSICTPTPEIPGLDAKDLVAQYRPSMANKLTIGEYDFYKSAFLILCRQAFAFIIVFLFIFYAIYAGFRVLKGHFRVLCWVVKMIFAPTRRPQPPPPSTQFQAPQTPRQQVPTYIPTTKKQDKVPAHHSSPARSSANSRAKPFWPPKKGKYSPVIGTCSHRDGTERYGPS